jgi:hypothetical protein
MTTKFNPFHLVDVRPWPILASNGALALVLSGLAIINKLSPKFIIVSLILILIVAFS